MKKLSKWERFELTRKQLWLVIAALIMLNCLTVAFFLTQTKEASGLSIKDETVAQVGKSVISKQVWQDELIARFGKDVLKEMIDQKVIHEIAEKYKIKIADKEVERELRMLQTTYHSPGKNLDEEKMKEQIRSNLLLEEILTKDVVIPERELKSYYEKNKELFNVPTAYHLSHIVVKTKDEAKKVVKELGQGSSFPALAMEKSIDDFSASAGGDIGYISEEDEQYPKGYIQTSKSLKKGELSRPLKVDEGYAILKLEGIITGKEYSFKEVKEKIRRQMALEQMKNPASARTFWSEAKVKWLYGNTK